MLIKMKKIECVEVGRASSSTKLSINIFYDFSLFTYLLSLKLSHFWVEKRWYNISYNDIMKPRLKVPLAGLGEGQRKMLCYFENIPFPKYKYNTGYSPP